MEEKQDYTSNYKKLCVEWRQKFLTWDHQKIYHKLNLPGYYDDHLEITYFGIPYSIDRNSGIITNMTNPSEENTFSTEMAIYHLFYYSKEHPKQSKIWIPFREVKGAAPFERAFERMILKPFAHNFSGRTKELISAGERLGFQRLTHGDVSFYVEAFTCIPMKFIFWDGDDEFPAQFNILFDKNITDFTHEETVVLLAEEGADLFMGKRTIR